MGRLRQINKHLSSLPRLSRAMSKDFKPNVFFPDDELRQRLSQKQHDCTQNSGTEYPGTGKYNKFFKDGNYNCVVCGIKLFNSDHKYDSGCGWPAFHNGIKDNIVEIQDYSHG